MRWLEESSFLRWWVGLLLMVFLWLVASVVTSWFGINLLSPLDIGGTLWGNFQQPEFRAALLGSARRMLIGYSLVTVLGVLSGLLLGRIPLVDQILGSFAVAVHAIPGAAWVPLAILWFGMTEKAVIFTILLGSLGVVMVNTDTGVRQVPPWIARAAKTMGARGLNYFIFVEIPAAVPKIVEGLRLAWAFGWRALMAGELLTSVSGLGGLLNEVAKNQQLDQLLAIMLLIAGIGVAVDTLIFKQLEHKVRVRWGLVE